MRVPACGTSYALASDLMERNDGIGSSALEREEQHSVLRHKYTLIYFASHAAQHDSTSLNLAFTFDIREISEIDDRGQHLSIPMYFSVAWLESRLWINQSSPAWDERTSGPKDVSGTYITSSFCCRIEKPLTFFRPGSKS